MAIAARINTEIAARPMYPQTRPVIARPCPFTRPATLRISEGSRLATALPLVSWARDPEGAILGSVAMGAGVPHDRQKRSPAGHAFPHLAQRTILCSPQAATLSCTWDYEEVK